VLAPSAAAPASPGPAFGALATATLLAPLGGPATLAATIGVVALAATLAIVLAGSGLRGLRPLAALLAATPAPRVAPRTTTPAVTSTFAASAARLPRSPLASAAPLAATAPPTLLAAGFRDRAAGTRHDAHPIGPGAEAQESTRAFLLDGDDDLGPREPEGLHPFPHRVVQRLAFEHRTFSCHV
jgi:hypothetical protein